MTFKNNKKGKFSAFIFVPTLAAGLIFSFTACAKNNPFVWTGVSQTFNINYDKFPFPTIQSSEVLDSYFYNEKFENMFCQDVIYKMNFDWKIWSPSQILNYRISASRKIDKLSWDLQIRNEQQDLLLWWTISSLKYQWITKQNESNDVITIIPENVEITDNGYLVKDQFWDDAYFDMVVKYRQTPTEDFVAYEFSCKTGTFEREKINEIIEFVCFQPHYYEGVIVKDHSYEK